MLEDPNGFALIIKLDFYCQHFEFMLTRVLDLSKLNLEDFLYFAAKFVTGISIGIQITSQFVFLSILLVPLPRLMRTICPLFAPQIHNIQCFHFKCISLMDLTLHPFSDILTIPMAQKSGFILTPITSLPFGNVTNSKFEHDDNMCVCQSPSRTESVFKQNVPSFLFRALIPDGLHCQELKTADVELQDRTKVPKLQNLGRKSQKC